MKNKIKSVLFRFGWNMTNFAEYIGVSKASLSNKVKRGSWNAIDLINLAEMTNTELSLVDKSGKVIITFEKEDIIKKEPASI